MYGLVNCNNFYCSCERVFNPALRDVPVVVLSNNDGCVIARSNEAKALGIGMGVPYYQARNLLEANKVAVFSSNYALYGDMSRRVMMMLADFSPELTQYSIDEAFIDLSGLGTGNELYDYGRKIVKSIGRGTGIPVTMGIAPTKTLAKVAGHYGKRYKGYGGVCMIDTDEKRTKALMGLPIGEVWGIRKAQQGPAGKRRRANGMGLYAPQRVVGEAIAHRDRRANMARTAGHELHRHRRTATKEKHLHQQELCRRRTVRAGKGGGSRGKLCRGMLTQAKTTAQLLRHAHGIRLHEPVQDRHAPLPHQPYSTVCSGNQRPTGNSEHGGQGAEGRMAGRQQVSLQKSRCNNMEHHARQGNSGRPL